MIKDPEYIRIDIVKDQVFPIISIIKRIIAYAKSKREAFIPSNKNNKIAGIRDTKTRLNKIDSNIWLKKVF